MKMVLTARANYIQIDHGSEQETLYAHCSSTCAATDQQMRTG